MHTPAIARIISVKNARAWVSMVSYLNIKIKIKIKVLKREKNPGSRLGFAC